MNFPKYVRQIVDDAMEKHEFDVDKSTEEAVKLIYELPKDLFDARVYIYNAVKDLVYDARHRRNVETKKQLGKFGKPPQVNVAGSPAVQAESISLFLLCIAGKELGNIFGNELAGIAASEAAIGDGHHLNSRLCAALAKVVPDDKQVVDSVGVQELVEIFERVKRGGA